MQLFVLLKKALPEVYTKNLLPGVYEEYVEMENLISKLNLCIIALKKVKELGKA